MSRRTTRRGFLKTVSASAVSLSGLSAGRAWPLAAGAAPRWKGLSRLDGRVDFDEAAREQVSMDLGAHFHRVPAAVLRPRSAQDIVKIVRFASTEGLKIAMRGQGHSQYGQTLAEGGIVVDSSTLNAVRLTGQRTVDTQAGASWDEVSRATLSRGLTPPAMGDTMTLSVGGILSAGGISNSSHLFGGVVDNVEELDVVTGAGDLVTCSLQRNKELFELALAGMGQCGLIVGARLQLVAAPNCVVRRDLDYDDLRTFLSDLRSLATETRVEHLGAYVAALGRKPGLEIQDQHRKVLCVTGEGRLRGARDRPALQVAWRPVVTVLLRLPAAGGRQKRGLFAGLKTTPSRLLYIAMFMPASTSEEFVARILATPSEVEGMRRFSLYMLPTPKFARPMFMLPQEDLALNVWLFRGVPIAEESRYLAAVATVRGLAEKMRAASGKAYPPYAPFFTRSDWETHYGPTQWRRLLAGKKAFDPKGVLTPGTGMFVEARPAQGS